MNEPQTLQSLVRQALADRDASGRRLAGLASERGFTVAGTTLNHIAAGTYKHRPSEATIRAIAWLAGVSEETAFAAAGVPMPGPPFSEELPPGVDNLSPRSRRAAIEVLRALVEAEREGGEHDVRSASITQAGESPAGKREGLKAKDQAQGGQSNVTPLKWSPLVQDVIDMSEAEREEWAAEEEAAHPMPEGGTEYQKRTREQDEAAEAGDPPAPEE